MMQLLKYHSSRLNKGRHETEHNIFIRKVGVLCFFGYGSDPCAGDPYKVTKRTKAILCLMTFWLTAALLPLASGQTPTYTIQGTVSKSTTGELLPGVNVFLSGTTLGAITDLRGFFEIRTEQPGAYDLIIRHIGYETRVIKLQIFRHTQNQLTVKLAEKPINMAGVTVTAHGNAKRSFFQYGDDGWSRKYHAFKDAFFGPSPNAKQCEITNPGALQFSADFFDNEALCDSVIMVENRSLGYCLSIELARFTWNHSRIKYHIYPKFDTLAATTPDEWQQWLLNRRNTYKGSVKHFLCSFYHHATEQENFLVLLSEPPFNNADTKRQKLSDQEFYQQLAPVIESCLDANRRADYPVSSRLLLLPEWLNIHYDSGLFPGDNWLNSDEGDEFVVVDSLGNILNPIVTNLAGGWAERRIADMLPSSYHP